MFFLYMTKIDLFSLFIFILFVLFCIPGTCVFYNSLKKKFLSICDQIFNSHVAFWGRFLWCGWVGDYERIINYNWPYLQLLWQNFGCIYFSVNPDLLICPPTLSIGLQSMSGSREHNATALLKLLSFCFSLPGLF